MTEQEEFEFRRRYEQEQAAKQSAAPEPSRLEKFRAEQAARNPRKEPVDLPWWIAPQAALGEGMLSLGTGAIAAPVSGLMGIAGSIAPGPPGQGAQWAQQTAQDMTYQPRTRLGQTAVEQASMPFVALSNLGNYAGENVAEMTGSPALGAATNAGVQFVPSMIAKGVGMATGRNVPSPPSIATRAPATQLIRREPTMGGPAVFRSGRAQAMESPTIPLADLAERGMRPTRPAAGTVEVGQAKGTFEAPKTPQQEALDAGYRLTPTQLERGTILKAVEGLSGSAKLEKLASVRNQKVTNEIIAKDFGLPSNRKVTSQDFTNIRNRAGEAYEAVKRTQGDIAPDRAFQSDLQALRGDFTEAANFYPDIMDNAAVETLVKALDKPAPARAMVELTRKLRKDATSNLKAFDDPAKRELGMAQRKAATALEDLIDRRLTESGQPDLVSQWRDARQTIAKSYDAESAFNDVTGNFSARQLARMYEKDAPLSGGMEKVAKTARAFEGSMRDVDKM